MSDFLSTWNSAPVRGRDLGYREQKTAGGVNHPYFCSGDHSWRRCNGFWHVCHGR